MESGIVWIVLGIAALLVAFVFVFHRKLSGPPVPEALRPGKPLPGFTAIDEAGNEVSSGDLAGAPAVILFVRGNWCPFCSKQVANLTNYYKDIVDTGAKLILLTPKPLETTRRVAEFFEVDFDFWLDESLHVGKQLGLVAPAGVPKEYRTEYGDDTLWPTALVVDGDGIIRYSKLSRFTIDRPNPEVLLKALRSL